MVYLSAQTKLKLLGYKIQSRLLFMNKIKYSCAILMPLCNNVYQK